MTATNHALTGAIIGLTIQNPWIAIPAAFLSHYLCDALPHFDSSLPAAQYLKTRRFKIFLGLDALLCMTLVLILAVYHPASWFVAAISAFAATLPDTFWLNQFWKVQSGKKWRPNTISRFGIRIQWFAKPIGGFVELAWLVGAVVILWQFL